MFLPPVAELFLPSFTLYLGIVQKIYLLSNSSLNALFPSGVNAEGILQNVRLNAQAGS
jgi:hypothetical protein